MPIMRVPLSGRTIGRPDWRRPPACNSLTAGLESQDRHLVLDHGRNGGGGFLADGLKLDEGDGLLVKRGRRLSRRADDSLCRCFELDALRSKGSLADIVGRVS